MCRYYVRFFTYPITFIDNISGASVGLAAPKAKYENPFECFETKRDDNVASFNGFLYG